MTWEQYTRLPDPDGPVAECPCCGADGELWQFQAKKDAAATKVVMCATGAAFGPQSGVANEGCPLYMPSDDHYRATIREALKYWNEFSAALMRMQRENRWKRHKALRATDAGPPPSPLTGELPARGPMCRDCADFGPICPNDGRPCATTPKDRHEQ